MLRYCLRILEKEQVLLQHRDLGHKKLGQAIDNAGHGIGRNLGGPGGVRGKNIFPQSFSVKRGDSMQFEIFVANEVRAGKDVFIRVVPRYNGDATRPFEILCQVRINGPSISNIFPNP